MSAIKKLGLGSQRRNLPRWIVLSQSVGISTEVECPFIKISSQNTQRNFLILEVTLKKRLKRWKLLSKISSASTSAVITPN